MSETEKPEEKTEKISSKGPEKAAAAKPRGAAGAAGGGEKKISSSGPERVGTTMPRGAAGADVEAEHAPSEKPRAAAKAAPKSPAAATKPRGDAGAEAEGAHAPSKEPPAAAKAAAPKPPAAAKAAAPKASGTLRIRQVKSGICAPLDQKQTLLGLGLRRIRQEVLRPDTPAVRGQVHKVRHLVEIVESGAAR